jgi:hypothetical protein
LKVSGHDELLAMRDRLRSKGVPVIGPIDHGMCCSIYFAGPEHLSLELSYSTEPIDNSAWIDPEVVKLAGINGDELDRYKNPAAFDSRQGSVAQPDLTSSDGPHLTNYPHGVYEKVIQRDDADMLNSVPNLPPVKTP